MFRFYDYSTLTTSYDAFPDNLYYLIFGTDKPNEEEDGLQERQVIEGNLSGIDVYRENFLFSDRTFYEFVSERIFGNVNIPIINTFENNLFQTELLNEYFIEAEKKKVINNIIDIEKDVYYPCVRSSETDFNDVYTIKFNLHFREHRGDDWVVNNESYWNGVNLTEEYFNNDDNHISKTAYENLSEGEQMNWFRKPTINEKITSDGVSDLLHFLNFSNDDVHYQKNKLKKSFLRLSFYDSMNPANQNLISTNLTQAYITEGMIMVVIH